MSLQDEIKSLKATFDKVKHLSDPNKNNRALHEVRNSLRDLVYAGENAELIRGLFAKDSFENLQRVMAEDRQEVLEGEPSPQKDPNTEKINWLYRYATAIKSIFFFARSLQDALYRLVLESNNQKPNQRSTMSTVIPELPKESPISSIISEKIPKYVEWFDDLKKKRDYIKTGAPTGSGSSVSSGGRFSADISFIYAPEGKVIVDLQYLENLFAMCIKFTNIIFDDQKVKAMLVLDDDSAA